MANNKQSLPSPSEEVQKKTEDSESQVPQSRTESEEPKEEKTTPEESAKTIDSNEQVSSEEAKSETDKAIGVVESAREEGTSEDSTSQQTHSEAQENISEPVSSEPSGALQSDEPPSQTTPPTPQEPTKGKWYVVHTYSGHENKVAATLKQRIESEHLQEKIFEVLVPMQDKIEIKSGKKITIKEKIFPGYILVKMDLDDISWLAVRTTQGVTSFVGMGNKPTPISDAEVQTIVRFTKEEAPTFKQVFAADDTVKIVDGPFAEFIGKVDSVDEEKGKVRVLVSIFGRETPVELDFLQVTKI